MRCYVRLMRREDIALVTEIDREVFPTMWPMANYQHELNNCLAHYVVACDGERKVDEPAVTPDKRGSGLSSWLRQLINYGHFFGNALPPSAGEYIVGFAGFWIMADEAHITSIAVREIHRRQGVGELLLIALIELAAKLNARIITLEVRASNTDAQNLYYKYGFTKVGQRRGYYLENREDGVIMSTEDITSAPFQARLKQLKEAHFKKWGMALCEVA